MFIFGIDTECRLDVLHGVCFISIRPRYDCKLAPGDGVDLCFSTHLVEPDPFVPSVILHDLDKVGYCVDWVAVLVTLVRLKDRAHF